MKKLFIIYVIAASIGFSSCTGLFGEGQLDMAPVEDINEDKIFSDYAMSVSYTHLDVYKRQHIRCTGLQKLLYV